MPRSLLVVIVALFLLALGLVVLTGVGVPGGPARPREPAPPRDRPLETPLPAGDAALAGQDEGPDGPTAGAPGAAPPGPEAGEAPRGDGSAPGTGMPTAGGASDPSAEVPPALRPNPRAPPPPRPGAGPGGGSRPPMGPTGMWEKFPPEPPSGRAALHVLVLDRDGAPVVGAEVFIGPPEAAGSGAVSFGDLLRVGTTGGAGDVTGRRLPEGSASVAANLEALLNGPRGLDARTAARVVLVADKTTEAEVRLPLALADLGAIRGIVVDPSGRPLASAQVMAGFCRKITGRDGAFLLPAVPSGATRLAVARSGYRPVDTEVDVPAGGTAEISIALEYAEGGTLALSGVVVGPEGEPVPGAAVYLMAAVSGGQGTVRSAETDGAGRFEMESLPDRLADTAVRLQATRAGYRPALLDCPELPGGAVTLRMPLRLVRLSLLVVDGSSGEPQGRCRFEARAEGASTPDASFSSRSADGRYEAWLCPGPHQLLVESPDHEPLSTPFDAGPGGGEVSFTARLVAVGEGATEVRLSVRLTNAVDGSPVTRAEVTVLDPRTGGAVASLAGERPDGLFVLPAPSGERRLRVTAEGFADHEDSLVVESVQGEMAVELRLVPR